MRRSDDDDDVDDDDDDDDDVDDDEDDDDQWHGEGRMGVPSFSHSPPFYRPSATLPAVCIGTWLILVLGTFGTWYWYTQNDRDLPSVCICKYQALCIPGSEA